MLPIDTSELVYGRTKNDTYEAEDLNRVVAICEAIAAAALSEIETLSTMRAQYGTTANEHTLPDFTVPTVLRPKENGFAITDTYTLEQMRLYLLNVANIVAQFPPALYKALPANMRYLTFEAANNIEEDLKQSAENLVSRANRTETNIKNTAAAFVFSGEIYAGGIT